MSGRKRHQPSRKKLERARKDGDTAKSREMTAACVLATAFFAAAGLVSGSRQLTDFLEKCAAPAEDFHTNTMLVSVDGALRVLGGFGLPLALASCAAALLVEVAQAGIFFSWKSLGLRWSRLNLFQGFKRMLGIDQDAESLLPVGLSFEILKMIGALLLVGGAGSVLVALLLKPIYAASLASVEELEEVLLAAALQTLGYCLLAVFAVGGADLVFQRLRRTRRLQMDSEELKRELRESEGDPELRGMRKQVHQELLRHGFLEGVRRANVIVVGRAPGDDR